MKNLLAAILFLSACTTPTKREVVETQRQQPTVSKAVNSMRGSGIPIVDLLNGGLGYAITVPLAGVGYTADGVLYAASGTIATIGYCWPILVIIAARGTVTGGAPVCFFGKGKAYSAIEKYHPKLGKNMWQWTQPMREPLSQYF